MGREVGGMFKWEETGKPVAVADSHRSQHNTVKQLPFN